MKKLRLPPSIQFTETQRAAIDGLRGFLALWVFCYHFFSGKNAAVLDSYPIVQSFIGRGEITIQMFFFISGFLIFVSYAHLAARFNQQTEIRFFIRRTFRVWPAWIFALALTAVQRGASLQSFFWNLFFIFGLHPYNWSYLIVYQSWSIFPEEIFYVCFPVLFGTIKKIGFIPVFLVSLLMAAFWWSTLDPILVPDGLQWDTPLSTFAVFLSGAACVWVVPRLSKVGHRSTAVILDLTLSGIIAVLMIYGRVFINQLLAAALLFCALYPKGVFHWIFSKIFKKLGVRCFSFYLIHVFAIDIAEWMRYRFAFLMTPEKPKLDMILHFVLASVVTLAFSELLFRLIERPFHRLGYRLSEYPGRLFSREAMRGMINSSL